ncbi:MAG TPA: thermonuclease family protein [Nocardioidaceae bacterium]|nr:thermonuclease family protein [Nocardioidaceae bacterium]
MLKKILVVLVALWVIGALLGEDDESRNAAGDSHDRVAEAGADDSSTPSPTPSPKPKTPATKSAAGENAPTETPSTPTPSRKPARTHLVTRVIDGDTIELGNGERVRLVGIDTPERGECGYAEATANMERLVLGKRVSLAISDEDRDRYDRLLRYVLVGDKDAGLNQINRGLAIARYDSRDGYGYHPRENKYVAADLATPDLTCAPQPKPQPAAPAVGCADGYSPCIPPYPPDIDCSDVDRPISVTGSDPHGLDRDGDGVACES